MPKLKLTKTELKSQQDALKQYQRFLPTLQLKKQQLQLEMRQSLKLVEANRAEYRAVRAELERYVAIYAAPDAVRLVTENLRVKTVHKGTANIAGVTVPVFDRVEFAVADYDLYRTEFWVDGAIMTVERLVSVLEAGKVVEEQYRLLADELRTTTQRVNLFEKVKIPEARANIRKIQIYMGDEQTAGVVRSKIAKRKMVEVTAA